MIFLFDGRFSMAVLDDLNDLASRWLLLNDRVQ